MRWLAALPSTVRLCILRWRACALMALATLPCAGHAETLIALTGPTAAEDNGGNSYGWQIEFQEPLSRYLTGSLSWLNEGHYPGHHRDGAAGQLWLFAPNWLDRFNFGLGVGPYFYFDTQPQLNIRGYSNAHGAAAIASASMSFDFYKAWFLSVNINDIYAPGNLNTATFMFGGGYHFGKGDHFDPLSPNGTEAGSARGRQQIQLFAGEMIYNELESQQDGTFGLEYRLSLVPWAAWSAVWFHQVGHSGTPGDQVATQLWLVDSLRGGSLSLSAGLGIYTSLGSQAASAASGSGPGANVSGLSGLRVEWYWNPRSSLILSWFRSFTNDDSDRDIITLGYGFRFGG